MSAARPSLVVVNHFAVTPADGGGTRHFEMARELVARHGWRTSVAAADFHNHTRRYTRRASSADRGVIREPLDGVDFLWLWTAPYERNDWRRAVNWLSFGRSLLRWDAGAGRPDVVIGSSPHLFAALAAERLAARWRVPFVLEVRDLWPESLLSSRGKGPGYHALDGIARYLYRRARRIVVLARGSGSYLAERGVDPDKLVYVPNGVDVSAFGTVPRPARDTCTVLYAGAHGPANGLDVVLGAAEILRGEPRVRFLLVGDGAMKGELVRDRARRGLSNVEFRDPVPKMRMPELMAEADAGLMVLRDTPVFSYGVSPNKLFDYMGASLPVVCNVPGEVAGMVSASGAGEQAADASPAALADAVLRMSRRPPQERAAMGAAGREWVAREHGRPVLADRLDAALKPLLRDG